MKLSKSEESPIFRFMVHVLFLALTRETICRNR